MKKIIQLLVVLALLLFTKLSFAQGDFTLQTSGNVTVSWRLVSDFQRQGSTCWGWTYHIFISNGYNYPITLKNNQAYQNDGDGTACWQSGAVNFGGETIPAGRWIELTFRVISGPSGSPSTPGLKYDIEWNQ